MPESEAEYNKSNIKGGFLLDNSCSDFYNDFENWTEQFYNDLNSMEIPLLLRIIEMQQEVENSILECHLKCDLFCLKLF